MLAKIACNTFWGLFLDHKKDWKQLIGILSIALTAGMSLGAFKTVVYTAFDRIEDKADKALVDSERALTLATKAYKASHKHK